MLNSLRLLYHLLRLNQLPQDLLFRQLSQDLLESQEIFLEYYLHLRGLHLHLGEVCLV